MGQSHGSITHDLRRVHAGTNDFDAYFRVVLDDLFVEEWESDVEDGNGEARTSLEGLPGLGKCRMVGSMMDRT